MGADSRSLRQGDHAAFEAVYSAHVRHVHAFALRRCDTLADAEDVVAYCFAELWRQRATVEPDVERGFLPWLFTVAARRIHAVRLMEMRSTECAVTAARSAAVSAAWPVPRSSLVDVIEGVIAASSPQDQLIARLAWEHGLTSRDIEGRLGVHASTVRTRLQHIRRRIDAAQREARADD